MVNLTPQDTIRLIAKMRALYGRKFDQQWQGVDPQMLAETFAEGLQGLTEQELKAKFGDCASGQPAAVLALYGEWRAVSSAGGASVSTSRRLSGLMSR